MTGTDKGFIPPLISGGISKIEFLAANGYLDAHPSDRMKESDPKFQAAVIRYQEFAGIVPDGVFGPVALSRAADKRCGLPDLNHGWVKEEDGKKTKWVEFSTAAACTRKWGIKELTCCHNAMSFTTMSSSETDKAWWAGFVEWMKVCDVVFKRVPFSRTANFTHEKESIDGSSGTLAYHYLPGCGSGAGTSLGGRYDSGERWTPGFFQGVHGHEIGHGLGLDHSSDRGALLYPYYNGKVMTPQAWDIKEVVARYGKPSNPPGGPNDPTPPDDPGTPVTLEQRVFNLELKVALHDALIKHFHGLGK